MANLSRRGTWSVFTYGRRGNVYSRCDVAGEASTALKLAIMSFQRSQIKMIEVTANSEAYLYFEESVAIYGNTRKGNELASPEIRRLKEFPPLTSQIPPKSAE